MEIILTHENADFDAVASLLAAHKLNAEALPVLPERLNPNAERFVTLYQNGLPFKRLTDIDLTQVDRLTLVDTQRPPALKPLPPDLPTVIIDHHALGRTLGKHEQFIGEPVGAATTLLAERLQQTGVALTQLEATLLGLGIYEDTGSLTYGGTTPRDVQMCAWLLTLGASLDTIRRFLSPPLTEEQQHLLDDLLAAAETRNIEGHTIIVSAASVEQYISQISGVAGRLRDVLDPTAVFVLVKLPQNVQLVARSADDAIDAGDIARIFGGGGHARAAAATIYDRSLEDSVALIWSELEKRVRPVIRVEDLMSYRVQTVEADEIVQNVVRKLRRIGHEGYPVVDKGRVIGLLTRRDADRVMEHGLGHLPVRDIMTSGAITLRREDSVFAFEQRMVESGWGQIPVIDDHDALIGIVTRTDLIKHWARLHPATPVPEDKLPAGQIELTLGKPVTRLIHLIAQQAEENNCRLYLVGGVVRDLLLNRRNLDVDFVVEGDAIRFAHHLQSRLGGAVSSFQPFGTAKWRSDESILTTVEAQPGDLPDHIDFASARNEIYEHPTALPTVFDSSIKLDLQRRDFTINTLAVQLSPTSQSGRILDFFGGLRDLRAKLIRVLHSLSFVDDPTRILRAVRFERRLGFTIEPRTAELITSARPMLGRITGERLRNEFDLLFHEPEPELALLELQERGVLSAIHPAFLVSPSIAEHFRAARRADLPWPVENLDRSALYWHVLAAALPADPLERVCQRLLFGTRAHQSMLDASNIVHQAVLTDAQVTTSQIVRHLTGRTELALLAAWLVIEHETARERIRQYWTEWQHIRPTTDGHALQEMGLKPGPCYALILNRLRDLRLDSHIQTSEQEQALIQKWLAEEAICDDRD